MSNNIVLFESKDHEIRLDVEMAGTTVWLSQAQLAKLFDKDQSVISRHISNAVKEGEITRESNMQKMHISSSDRPVIFYDLDVVISVGYRVKSQRGVEFRRWATDVLHRCIIDGYAENGKRLDQLGQVARVMARFPEDLETRQVLDIVQSYTAALDLLDDYDHQRLQAPKGSPTTYVLDYEECRAVIDGMRFGNESDLLVWRKTIPSKVLLATFTRALAEKKSIPACRKRLLTCCTSL